MGAVTTPGRAGTSSPSPVAVAPPVGPLTHAGRWTVDTAGRVVVVHGVNMPSKTLPAHPAALGFGDDDASFLASEGFNAVRVTVERYAVEPTPGSFDDAYLAEIVGTVTMLARHGIVTMVDFHQDDFGPVFYDNGYPDWMTMTDGLANLFFEPFPTQYLGNPALERAFDHLWANDVGPDGHALQDDDAALLAHVALTFKDLSGLLGYEIINEPWPGSAYATCADPAVGCPSFDQGPFSAYYARTIAAVRAADPITPIWYEPHSMFNQGAPTSVSPPADSNLGFAFHDYGLCGAAEGTPVGGQGACQAEDAIVVRNALAHQAATGNALLETEFGATFDTAALDSQLALYDQNMIPWMFWSYTHYLDAQASDGTLQPPTTENVDQSMLATLARPYPQLVSGTPTSWSFDATTKRFTFAYATDRADGTGAFGPGSETDIALPPIQYPNGYVVTVDGGIVRSAPGDALLRVLSSPGATAVTVTVVPAP